MIFSKNNIAFLISSLYGILSVQGQFRLTANEGQWDNGIEYTADLKSAKLYISKGQLTYLFYDAEKIHHIQHDAPLLDTIDVHVIKVDFVGSNTNAVYEGQNAYSDYSNYYIGNNPEKWRSRVKSYRKLYVYNIYPQIDFELFEDKGKLKYNFIVKPGADPSLIKMRYNGADSLYIKDNRFNVKYRFGCITEMEPFVYEENDGETSRVLQSAYTLVGNELQFSIGSKRDKKNTLVIDPILVFSTYSGSQADNFGYTATYDTAGHAYAGGTVFGFGFPTTTGAHQMFFNGGTIELRSIGYVARDCGITKYSSDGRSLLFSTYIGGTFSNEQPHSMIVDSRNNLLVMGTTKSQDFPIGVTPAFDWDHNGLSDVFVVKFTEDGTQLLAGTFVGGSGFDGLNGDRPSNTVSPLLNNYADDFRGEIIVDKDDNVYVSTSSNSSDFPVVNGFDISHGGRQDGVVFSLTPDLSAMRFSSFIGGNGDDAAYGLDLGTNNDLYVTGGSNSGSFNYSVLGLRQTNNGGIDGYLLRLNIVDFTLMSYTFIGTSSYDQSYFVKTDKYGKPFIYGQSQGNHGVSSGVYFNQNSKMFLKKLNFDLTAIERETTFGGENKTLPDISPTALMVDECERIFVSGWGGVNFADEWPGGGTGSMPFSADAFQKTTDGYDFYLAVFSKNFAELQYATFFGGRSRNGIDVHEHVDGGTSRFDPKGIIYQSVCAGCGGLDDFPTTAGVWSRQNNSQNCNNAIFKFDFENLNRKPIARDSFFDILATDSIDFEIKVSDKDRGDSLSLVLEGDFFNDPSFPKPLPKIISITPYNPNTENTIIARIKWKTNCAHAGLDTLKLYVKVYDKGCPTQDSNRALIRIIVKDPPLSITPETMCMFFKDDGSIKLSWKQFDKNRFFNYILLYRRNPNGTVKILDTIFDNNAGEFKDVTPSDPKSANYQYYMIGYNLCGKPYDAGVRINTLKEINSPIDSSYLHYATVFENKSVHLNWFKSKEEDFGSYDIYRTENRDDVSNGFRKIYTTEDVNDTNFIDTKVEVDKSSYCYRIGVNDKCGHVSRPSNEACNIVLTGEVGHLFFDLDWTPYRDWAGRVLSYELQRRVDTGTLRFNANTDLLRVYHDDDLDLWWGAYYYVVKAYEGINDSGIGYNATSLSNEIRLIQPPMVFVPNAFSPNGDGYNDVWGVSHAFVKEFRIMVYNRWGEKVWDNDFKGNQWDGITRGKLAMNDVFVWIVTYRGWDNRFYTQKGTVTVMP